MDKGKNNGKREWIIPAIAFFLIISGVYLAATHAYSWAKGVMAVENGNDGVSIRNMEQEMDENEGSTNTDKPDEGEKIGEISIPKLDMSVPIYEGTNEEELGKGAGHYSNSVMPGEDNNTVISGHRDTVFRNLKEVGENDVIKVETAKGIYTYRIEKVRIVDAEDKTVIVPKPEATLTLTTCYPFTYIGDAPERYVLVGNLINSSEK
ncbi:sortase A [Metabacillus crassostreae]|uniref:class D sortase n=1 Tax=Metabacillus crassostreae TaxID=929098 RepID=UPI00195E12A5|nr:class D sortase [Metabacillus crassostreae]MBM7602773.1 sortase A [Metabacillus crassostreae]